MSEEFETVELEYSEDDVLYYIEDEDGTEIGFAIMEDGQEVEYYYEGYEDLEYETVEVIETIEATGAAASNSTNEAAQPDTAGTLPATASSSAAEKSAESEEPGKHGYLYKIASIAGFEGNKKRKVAEEKLDVVRGKAEEQYGKAKKAASTQAGKAKAKANEMDIGITREDVAETTADLNAIAKEGAETAKELKAAYDDIMDSVGFLMPKKIRRHLP